MECAIFDMDGTLINSESAYYRVWEELIENEGYLLTKDFYKTILGCPTNQIRQQFLDHFGSNFPFETLFARFMKKRNEMIQKGDFQLTRGISEFLGYCQKKSIVCGVATSSHKEEATTLLKKMEIFDFFTFFAFGDEVTTGKPNPEIFELAVQRSGFFKDEIIVFEDSKNGVIAANSANLSVYLVNDFIPLESEYEDLAEHNFKNFSQVTDKLEKL